MSDQTTNNPATPPQRPYPPREDKARRTRAIQAAPSNMAAIKQAGPLPVRILVALLSVLVLVVSGAGYFAVGSVSNSAGNLALGGGKGVKPGQARDGATDILLVGIDSRTDAQGKPLTPEEIDMLRAGDEQNENTDTIIVIRIPNDGSSATAISIPRDTYIHDSQEGNMKINGVYTAYKTKKAEELGAEGITDPTRVEEESKQAGRQALISDVASLTGITVDHYAEVGLLGFVLLTDAVGGVDVCLNDDVNDPYSGANFHAGEQVLSGPDALSFVRQRHGLPRGDLDRIVRQQAYMASLVHKVLSSGTMTNPAKLNSLGDAAKRSLTIDDGWDIMGLADQMQNMVGGNVQFTTIPVTDIDGVGDYGESVVEVDVPAVHSFFDTLLNKDTDSSASSSATSSPSTTAAPKDVSVSVLNASELTGFAARVASALEQEGYPIDQISNAPAGLYAQSQVLTRDASDPRAKELAKLAGGVPVNVTGSLQAGEAVLVVASDYRGPQAEPSEPTDATAATSSASTGAAETQEEMIKGPTITAGGTGPRCVN